MQKILAFLMVLSSAPSVACAGLPCIGGKINAGSMALVQPVGIYGVPDRRTEQQFARENGLTVPEVQKRYAATGRLICARSELTANLVVENSLIATAAHAFVNFDTCIDKSEAKDCKFIARIGSKIIESKVVRLEAMGARCPGKLSNADDWAVLRLSNDIREIDPYSVDTKIDIESDQTVTAVNGINSDFYVGRRKIGDHVKSISRCGTHKLYRRDGNLVFFSSDCDGSLGGSGGAVLKDTGKTPVLLGITTGSQETPEQLRSALRRGRPNSGDFDETQWAAYHIPVTGDFLEAILRAANRRFPVAPTPATAMAPPTKPSFNPDDFNDFKLR